MCESSRKRLRFRGLFRPHRNPNGSTTFGLPETPHRRLKTRQGDGTGAGGGTAMAAGGRGNAAARDMAGEGMKRSENIFWVEDALFQALEMADLDRCFNRPP
ncbi:hypothetical protein CXB51_007035 [Gossypium anomalum]|uniref:Uncharacterized protein n=1 Tax=Gossypium anomalum TaxID=47600 RepID=A0A8J5ZL91_9ROSI|nr:hypothetical protein CXB51_007035 [Gossypium anomalum]